MKATKAQASIEILFGIGMIGLIFIALIFAYFDRKSALDNLDIDVKLMDTCFSVSNAINSAFINGEQTNITINSDFDITINGPYKTVSVVEGEEIVNCNILVYNNTINLAGANYFTISKGAIKVLKSGDFVVLQNI